MTAKCRILLSLSSAGILLALCERPCQGSVQKYRDTQEKIMQEAQQQIQVEPTMTRDITRDILAGDKKQVAQPVGPAGSAFAPIRQQINQLLAKQEIKPDELAVLRGELDRVAKAQGEALNRPEYDALAEKLDLAKKFVTVINELQSSLQSSQSIITKLDRNFRDVATTGDKAESKFYASIVGNIALLLGLMARAGNITSLRLDRELKRLEIQEKRALLARNGISQNKTS